MNRAEYLTRAKECAARGEGLPHSKLSAEKVRFIRLNVNALTGLEMALEMGVHKNVISRVKNYQSWVHIK